MNIGLKLNIIFALVVLGCCGGCNSKPPSCDGPKVIQMLKDNEMDGFKQKFGLKTASIIDIKISNVRLINKMPDTGGCDCKANMEISVAGGATSNLPMSYGIRKSDNKDGFEIISFDPF